MVKVMVNICFSGLWMWTTVHPEARAVMSLQRAKWVIRPQLSHCECQRFRGIIMQGKRIHFWLNLGIWGWHHHKLWCSDPSMSTTLDVNRMKLRTDGQTVVPDVSFFAARSAAGRRQWEDAVSTVLQLGMHDIAVRHTSTEHQLRTRCGPSSRCTTWIHEGTVPWPCQTGVEFSFWPASTCSLRFVWVLGSSWSTKLSWLNVCNLYMPPRILSICAYESQPSYTMWLPGRMHFSISRVSVAAVRSCASTRKHLPLSRSIPPNTQWPSGQCPLWHFQWKYFVSAISTTIGSPWSVIPSISSPFSSTHISHTSLKKLHQSKIVSTLWILVSCAIVVGGASCTLTYINMPNTVMYCIMYPAHRGRCHFDSDTYLCHWLLNCPNLKGDMQWFFGC